MSEVSLAVEVRESRGKGAARKLRAAGQAPAVIYGRGKTPVSVALSPKALDRIIHTHHAGMNALIDLKGAGDLAGRTVMVKDLLREPIRGDILHVDLLEVDLKARIEVSVPVHLVGTPQGVTLGGLLDHSLHHVDIVCAVGAIPDELVVDVSHLAIGDSIHVHQIVLPEGAEMQTPADLPVAAVIVPRAAVAEEGAEVAAVEAAGAAGEAQAAEDSGEGEKD